MMLTVVEANKDLCKKMVNGELKPYDNASLFAPELIEVNNLPELSKVLTQLEGEGRKAVIRDAPNDMSTGARNKLRYTRQALPWLCLDWDKPAPEGCPEYVDDPQGAIKFMINREWGFLKGVGVHWQLGNSAGLVPSSEKMSIHMWVWLDKPVMKCSKWLADKDFDRAMTRAVQLHYTASPIGVTVPARSGFIPGGVLSGVTEDPPPTQAGIKFAKGYVCTDEDAVNMAAELMVLEPVNGARHDAMMHWVLRAVTVAYPHVIEEGAEWLVKHGRSQAVADSEMARLAQWALEGLESGDLSPDIMLRPDLGFDDEEDLILEDKTAIEEQSRALVGERLFEQLAGVDDQITWLKENAEKVARLEELERLRVRGVWKHKKSAFDNAVKKAKGAMADAVAVNDDAVFRSGDWRGLAHCYKNGAGGLVIFNNDEWFAWNEKHYEVCPTVLVEKRCSDFMSTKMMIGFEHPEPVPVNRGTISNMIQQLSFERWVKELPIAAWINRETGAAGEKGTPFNNGILKRSGELVDAEPDFFSRFCLDFNYEPDASCDFWLQTLSKYMDGDEERILLVRQWFHYLLFRGTELQRICVLVGQPRAGKGTIMRVLERLLGEGNFSSPTMSDFISSFGLQKSVGKRAVLIGDAHIPKTDPARVLSLLKSISGEDSIQVDRKHMEPLSLKIGTIVMACNMLENIKDESGALTGRYSIINFRRTFDGAEDKSVEARIMDELPGIFNWARDCPSFDKFMETGLAQETKEELTEASNPVRSWARKELVEDLEGRVVSDDLLKRFQNFYIGEDGKPMSKAKLVKDLRLVFPYSRRDQWKEGGRNVRGLVGLKFADDVARERDDEYF